MIYDHLSNIDRYKDLSSDIYEGLCFLKQASTGVDNGIYEINPRVKAIVSEYEMKMVNEYGYEAHKKFIDIQCVLIGQEEVACSPIERLKEIKPYAEEKDASFYEANSQAQEVLIGNGFFAIFFPHDGYMPQLCIDKPQMVKKMVVKVEIV